MDFQHIEPRPHLRALTGLRGVAALVVMLGHFGPRLPYHLEDFFDWYTAAVDLFFCLSGFTLSYVYSGKSFDFLKYLNARFARIYPLYFVTLIIVAAIYTLPAKVIPGAYPADTAFFDFVRQVLLVNDWPIIGSGVHWSAPAWSLSIEWLCYLVLFPPLLRLKPPLSDNARLLLFAILSAISYASLLYFETGVVNTVPSVATAWKTWGDLLRGVSAFTAGWIAFWSFEQRDGIHLLCARFSTAIWLCFVAVLTLSYLGYVNPRTVMFLFPFVVLAATDPSSRSSRLLGSAPMHYIGDISYTIYMMHFVVYTAFLYLAGNAPTWTSSIHVALIGTTIATSALTFAYIEKPARDALRKWRIVPQAKGQMNPSQ